MSEPSLLSLRDAVRGEVLLPGEDAFDAAHKPWNLAVAQDVRAVVTAADADDVAALVRYADQAGLPIAVQPTGHGASGTAAGAILLRTGRLDELSVDPEARTARIGAGVKSGAVNTAAAAHGLVAKPGSSPTVSVAGYTLGGGVGFFARKYGMSSDHVIEFEVVDASGERKKANATENPDLFHALAGGGGDFAIVTALTVRLHEESELFGGTTFWPDARAAELFAAFRTVTATAPEELSLWISRAQFPGGAPAMVAVTVSYLGSESDGRALLKPFDAIDGVLSGEWKALPFEEIAAITNDPVDPAPSVSRSELLGRFDADEIAALLAEPVAPLLVVQVRHLGGALAGARPGPRGPVAEEYLLYLLGLAITPEGGAAVAAKQAELVAALGDAVTGGKLATFLGPTDTFADTVSAAEAERLRTVKKTWDPQGRFVANFPVGE
ncbi:FAD-binding oxidoreductase [Catenulispora rubra]|uniref:FAD-binding oxidoreductase n=1 Tax=Catenulispora rubra TaxID=280293 RepID=UPI001891FF46|nr:FAD-binding oxidoreductase [Catenulispora rubra]